MAQIDDLIKKLLEEKTASMNSSMSRFGDKMGINSVLSNPLFQKLRAGASAAKGGLHTLGAEKVDSMFGAGSYGNALVDSSGVALGLSTPFKGKEIAKQVEMANARKNLQSQAGYNNTGRDAIASTAASAANMKSLFNSTAMLSMVAGAGNSGLITPGIMASKMFGGLEGLGSASASGIAGTAGALGAGTGVTSAIAGANPMMMGIAAAMAATKATSALYKVAIDGGSSLKLGKKELITSGTSPHRLEQDYGNTNALRMQINKMQNLGSLKPGEALIANILAMIEGHTSVLPYIAANALDAESRRNKEGAGNAQNHLEDLFGNTGAIGSNDQLKKGQMGIVSKLFTGMEKTTANLSATFDIMGQLSNTLSGNSSTKLYNEANSKDKTPEMLKAEKKFGETFGIPTGMVQAIHTTPAQIMNSTDTYEGKVLSILGLQSEISRFSAHELLKIRTTGFGIKNDTTNGFLAKLNDQYEEERLHRPDDTVTRRMIKGADEILGYIPGWQVLSGSVKMFSGALETLNEFEHDMANNRVRSFKQVFSDWMGKDIKNDALGSEEELRRRVGAVELGPEAQMANYLGIAYPDRFELLLSYNLSQMESLQKLAGTNNNKLEKLTMNKYTGQLGNQKHHREKDEEIRRNMENEMNFLNEATGFLDSRYFSSEEAKDKARSDQVKEGMKTNDFLRNFIRADSNNDYELNEGPLAQGPGERGESYFSQTSETDSGDARNSDDMQGRQKAEEAEEQKLSYAEQQVALLQEIRDCCTGQEGRDYALENERANREAKNRKKDDDSGSSVITSMLAGVGGGALGTTMSSVVTMLPRLGLYGVAAAGAIAAGYMLYTYFYDKDNQDGQTTSGNSAEDDAKYKKEYESHGLWSSTAQVETLTNDALRSGIAEMQDNWAGDLSPTYAHVMDEMANRNEFYFVPVSLIFTDPLGTNAKLTPNGLRYLMNLNSKGFEAVKSKGLDLNPKTKSALDKLHQIQIKLDNPKLTNKEWLELFAKKKALVNELDKIDKEDHSILHETIGLDEKDRGIKMVSGYQTQNFDPTTQGRVKSIRGEHTKTYEQATGSVKEKIFKEISKLESGGKYNIINPRDGNGNGMSVGAFQFNERHGALKELLKLSNDPQAKQFLQGMGEGTFLATKDIKPFKKWFDTWGKSAEGINAQKLLYEKGYASPARVLAKSIGMTSPGSISQLTDMYVNRGEGGATGIIENIKNSHGNVNNPKDVLNARIQYYNSHKGDAHMVKDRAIPAYNNMKNMTNDVQDATIPSQQIPPLLDINGDVVSDVKKTKDKTSGKALTDRIDKIDKNDDKVISQDEITKRLEREEKRKQSGADSTRKEAATMIALLANIQELLSKTNSKEISIVGLDKSLESLLKPTPVSL